MLQLMEKLLMFSVSKRCIFINPPYYMGDLFLIQNRMLKRFLNICVVFFIFPFQLQAFTDIENNWYKDSITALQEQ